MAKRTPENNLLLKDGVGRRMGRRLWQPVAIFGENVGTRIKNKGSLDRVHGAASTPESAAYTYLERTVARQVSELVRQLLRNEPTFATVDESGGRKKKNSQEEFKVLESLQQIQAVIEQFAEKNRQDVQVLANGLEIVGAVIIAASEQVITLDSTDKTRHIRIYQRLMSLYDWLIFRSPLIATVRSHHTEGEKDAGALQSFRMHAVFDLLALQDALPLALTVSSAYANQPIGEQRFPESAISCFTDKTAYLSPDMRNLITFLLRVHPLMQYARQEKSGVDAVKAMEAGLCALIDTQEKLSGGLFQAELQKTQAYNTFFQLLIGLFPFFETNTIVRFAQLLIRDDGRFTKELYARWGALTPLLGGRSSMRPRIVIEGGSGESVPYLRAMQTQATALLVDKPLFTLDKPTSMVDIMTYVQLLATKNELKLGTLKADHVGMYSAVEPNKTSATEHGTLEDLNLRLVVGLENSFNRYFSADRSGKNYQESAAFCYMQLLFIVELLTPKTGEHHPTALDAAAPDHPKQVARKRFERLLVRIYQCEQDESVRSHVLGAVLQHIFSFWQADDVVALNTQYLQTAFEDPNRLLLRENTVFQWFFRLSSESGKFLYEKKERGDKGKIIQANIALLEQVISGLPQLLGTSGGSKISVLATLAVGTPWEVQLQNLRPNPTSGHGALEQAMTAYAAMEVLPMQANKELAPMVKALLAQVFDIIIWITGSDAALQQEAISRCGARIAQLLEAEITQFVPAAVPINWEQLIAHEHTRTASWLETELARGEVLSQKLVQQMPPVIAVLEKNQQQLFSYIALLAEAAARVQLPVPIIREVSQLREHMLQQASAGYAPVVTQPETAGEPHAASALVLHHTQLKESTAYISGMLATIQESLKQTSATVDAGFAQLLVDAIKFIQANQALQTFRFTAEVTQFLAVVERRTMMAQSGESEVTRLMQSQLEFLRYQDQVRMAVSLAAYQLTRDFLPTQVSALLHPQSTTVLTVVDNAV